jgi:hypothetical protein
VQLGGIRENLGTRRSDTFGDIPSVQGLDDCGSILLGRQRFRPICCDSVQLGAILA